MKRIILSIILSIPFLLSANTLHGKIVRISDGDTVTLLDSTNTQYKIRLDAIDAPEKGQPYGQKAKQYLSDLIFGKVVTVEYTKMDQYKRILGTIYYQKKNINEEMIRAGYAWRYYYNRSEKLLDIQTEARQKKRGLWRDNKAIDPYWYRKQKKAVE